MSNGAVLAFLLSVAALFAKYVVVTTVQGRARFASRTFRWPEDAVEWAGTPAGGQEQEAVERAQAVLRNDGETQPFYLAFGAAWVALGAPAVVVTPAAALYALARIMHALFFLYPRQPHRNRVFVMGQLVLLGIAVDVLRRACALVG